MAGSSNIQRPNASGRILVADDDPAIVDLVAEALRSEGYVCDCVGTADAAACAMATVSYDLLITDIRMPGNDTFATLRELRPGDNTPPIIVMTGQPTVGTVLEANRLSVVNYLIKPVDVQALRDLAALAIGKGKVLRALRKARTEIAVWQEGLAALETALLAADPSGAPAWSTKPADQAVDQMVMLFRQVLASLNSTIGLLAERPMAKDLCRMVNCRQSTAYQEAVRDAVDVLFETKGAFKSKELAELRKRLEAVLKLADETVSH
ncbi:MAG TPA: response regulator [Nitrospirales bacterium]|nr:response regulator [Nitrospirales bacterium]